MISLGVDVSSRKIAFAAIDEAGRIKQNVHVVHPGSLGARRLVQCRAIAERQAGRYEDLAVAAVEIPWARKGSSFALLSIAAVCLEAIQHVHPGAVVLDMPTQTWKVETVGRGNASKDECMAFAQGAGMVGEDQDVADATCLAQAAWNKWHREIQRMAAA